jgi:pimeloyl-ACP methyl ester carboxylesterase
MSMKRTFTAGLAALACAAAAALTTTSAAQAGQYLEVSPGVEIYYEDKGTGPALVLVPGWTFTTEVFEHQLAAFSDTHRVVTFDPRSHGRSTVTLEGNDYATQGADLATLMQHLELRDPVILGWSFGCLATWAYVREHGTDGLKGHVCIDLSPTPLTGVDGDWAEGGVADIAGFYHAVTTSQGQREVVAWYADEVMIEREMSPQEMNWIVDQSMKSPPWIAAAHLAAGMFSNYMEEAQKVDDTIPSLMVVAEHWADTARPYLATHTPNTQVEVLGGHMMFWEHHAEFNEILSAFLDGTN